MKVHCNHGYEVLSDEELDKIGERMYPGQYSQEGFLQLGERLREVYENDRLDLEEIGITYKQITDELTGVIKKSQRAQFLKRENSFRYTIEIVSYNGAQVCPFKNKKLDDKYHGYQYGDSDITITDTLTSQSITFNNLLLHMIEAHHFFESPLSSHRLDPKKVIEMFDLKSGIDYTPQYKHYYSWERQGGANFTTLTKNKIDMLQQIGLKTYQIDNDIIAILMPYRFVYFNDNFFTCLLVHENPISWKGFLTDFFVNSKYLKEKVNKVGKICSKIEKFQITGCPSGMYLYIFNLSKNRDKYKIMIENTEIIYHSSDVESEYVYSKNYYVPLDDEI